MEQIHKSLFISQGNPEEAHLRNPSYTEDEYELALNSAEYQDFLQDINKRFIAHLDSTLIYQQYEAFKMLEDCKSGKIDMKYLKDISKHFTDLLKLTEPIVERLGKQVREEERLAGLRLVISPPDSVQDATIN